MTYRVPSAIRLQVPHLDWLQRLVPFCNEGELLASCWTLTSFFLREDPVLLTKLNNDFFLVGGADWVLSRPDDDSAEEKLLDAVRVGSRFITTSRKSLSLSNVDITLMPLSGDVGTRIELLDSLCDLMRRSILHTLDVTLFTIFWDNLHWKNIP